MTRVLNLQCIPLRESKIIPSNLVKTKKKTVRAKCVTREIVDEDAVL